MSIFIRYRTNFSISMCLSYRKYIIFELSRLEFHNSKTNKSNDLNKYCSHSISELRLLLPIAGFLQFLELA